jgi:hypothetical protein
MKKLLYQFKYIICAVAMTAPLTGCSDFLDILPMNEVVLENYWTEKGDVTSVVNSCYESLENGDCITRMGVWGELRSDNLRLGSNVPNEINEILKENLLPSNPMCSWARFYEAINRCNTVCYYAPQVQAIDPNYTEEEMRANVAEASALRALCYFYLIRTFRDVPYSTEAYTDDDQEMVLPATRFEAVLDSLINDLESVKGQAVRRYPTTEPLYQTGRITQDAIYAMLCEMYLWKQDYARCIEYADLIIDSKKKMAEEIRDNTKGGGISSSGGSSSNENFSRTNGFPLISEQVTTSYYGNLFDVLFAYDDYITQGNQEIIFQLIFNDDPRGSSMPSNSAVGTFYGNSIVDRGYLAPSDYLVDDVAKSSGRTVFEDKNKKLDARLYENFDADRKCISKFVYRGVNIDASQTNDIKTQYTSKWVDGSIGSNWIIYRLTDIMLMKAEALAQSLRDGSDQETINYNTPILEQTFSIVNAINKRSVCQTNLADTLLASDYVTKVQMEGLVMRERQRELMFEGKRWYDLVRQSRRNGNTSELSQAALKKVTTGGSLIANKLSKMDAIYWPYNIDEMKVNNLLVQNPAFGSGEDDSYEKTK